MPYDFKKPLKSVALARNQDGLNITMQLENVSSGMYLAELRSALYDFQVGGKQCSVELGSSDGSGRKFTVHVGFEVNASMNDMPNGSAEMTKLQDKLFAEGVITHAQSAQLRGDISKELRSKSVGRF